MCDCMAVLGAVLTLPRHINNIHCLTFDANAERHLDFSRPIPSATRVVLGYVMYIYIYVYI